MTRQSFSRSVKITTASLMAVLFGFPGIAMANQASIQNTGPDSYNKIESNYENKCRVENNNNVKAINHVTQNAQTGDATVGGSGWEAYSPEAWQENGHSYQEWESAVSSYMAQNKSQWKNNWGHSGGNTTGGDATSGNASNVSNNRTNISIDNSGACANQYMHPGNNGNSAAQSTSSSKPTHQSGNVLGESVNNNGSSSGEGEGQVLGSGGGSYNNQSGVLSGTGGNSGGGGSPYNTTTTSSGGSGGGSNGAVGNNFQINNTGPDSYNKISYSQSNQINVNNSNNVFVKNHVTQNANSGNASVSGNTTGGAAGSGGAHNSSGSNNEVGIK